MIKNDSQGPSCTCPSGDGSLVHPCPAHPAVEQADVAAKLTFINGRPAMCGCQVEYSDGGGEYSDVIYVTLCAKHSGSAILDLVATNRIALTPEYEGQWHADLYLDREIPLAKVEGATPAEAVLALMSAERIDPEQESVEQAGGDERAAFEAWLAQAMSHHFAPEIDLAKYEDSGEYRYNPAADYWKAWQARAALAQPSPAPELAERGTQHRFSTTEQTCRHDFYGVWWNDSGVTKTGRECRHCGFFVADMTEAAAEQAEAERPEVVAYADPVAFATFKERGHEGGVAGREWMWAEPGAALVAMSRTDECERIVGALRAENAKLSEDLNRLSIIRARLNLRLDFALDKISKLESRWPHGESPEERFEHYISNTIDRAPEPLRRLGNWLSHVLDEDQWTTAERMLTGACVAAEERAAAQTQHSVPEGWKPVPIEPLLSMMSDKDHDTRIMAERQLLSILADAPGKEMPQAWLDVQAERRRQVEAEGWTPEHDDEHSHGQMARAAACYALAGSCAPNDGTAALLVSLAWPWDEQWWKPTSARRDLVKACALVLAEIERLDRAAATQGGPSDA
ncbi:TPA: hypothetical protein ACXOGI_003706 [Pseudomonas aeruginosa]|uniref:hypothetical protein n=1 Tax=Pseudomonas aeruginosa TaxID=287 RepID=UPI000F83A948|nr:hypothetical protein [Pseudomonas aeruginosa]RTW48645.1 hypothetical protein DZA06_21535 [Pseudomonas aeruginosa]